MTQSTVKAFVEKKMKHLRNLSFHFCSDETCDRLLHAIPFWCAPSRANLLVFLKAIPRPRNNKMAPGVEDIARLFCRGCHFITISRLFWSSINKYRQDWNVFGCGLIIKVWKWLVKGGFSVYLLLWAQNKGGDKGGNNGRLSASHFNLMLFHANMNLLGILPKCQRAELHPSSESWLFFFPLPVGLISPAGWNFAATLSGQISFG